MKLEFDVNLTEDDMYRFNMYHVYSGFHGVFSIIIAVMAFVVAAVTWGNVGVMYSILYVVFGLLLIFYMPVSLKMKSKHQLLTSEELKRTLHYSFDENGVHVSQNEDSAELPWDQVYKMVATKSNVLIYSNRMNAFVIPRSVLGGQYEKLKEFAVSHLPKYRVRMK